MGPKNDAELDVTDPRYDEVWERLDAECRRRRTRIERILGVVKTSHRIPAREIDQEIRSARVFLNQISLSRLRRIDRDEYAVLTARQVATLSLLQRKASGYARPTSAQIRDLLDENHHPDGLVDRIERYESQTMLVLVSKPEGNEYWQLLRSIANGVRRDRGTAEGGNNQRLARIDSIVHMLAPVWLFNDNRRFIPTNSKLAWRTTKIHGIYSAGLPGLGKKA